MMFLDQICPLDMQKLHERMGIGFICIWVSPYIDVTTNLSIVPVSTTLKYSKK